AIVLYGNNVATYKIALASCLITFAEAAETHMSLHELAAAFFRQYRQRLAGGQPQLSNAARKTVLERVVEAYDVGDLTEAAAVQGVARPGFGDVLPRFHIVNGEPLPTRFYTHTPSGLVLTDELLGLFAGAARSDLRAEVASRWDLLEPAF